ncbi:MAG: PepSY domain-containing protein [Cyanobacteria bacterium P01_E01_bin.42]
MLPLFVTAVTGVLYRLLRQWFDVDKTQVKFLIRIHEGRYLGDILNPIYVLLEGLGLCILLVTGAIMLWKEIKSWFVGTAKSPEAQKVMQKPAQKPVQEGD